MRGWFDPGFWPITKIASAMREVVEADRALAHADRRRETDAARLVTHVRAVGQVVGAEAAREQLVQERRLVAGAARRVEERLVGRDAARAGRARCPRAPRPTTRAHNAPRRARDAAARRAALLLEPVIALPSSAGIDQRAKKAAEIADRRLVRDRLRAVSRRTRSPLRSRGSGHAQPGNRSRASG
jgi:hypothetical protein